MALREFPRRANDRHASTRGRRPRVEDLESRQLLATSITEFPITAAGTAIVAGPDGNLWFLQNQAIGEFNPTTHATSSFPLPGAFSLAGLAAGPDGQLWFTNLFFNGATESSAIGSLNPTTHAVAEFPVPSLAPDLGLGGITAGADGNLWFTEGLNASIGMIDPTTHVIRQFPLPGSPQQPPLAKGQPFDITTSPGGFLWFTVAPGSGGSFFGIGLIDPGSKEIAEFPTPASAGVPRAITAGPDGNLWFTAGNLVDVFNPPTGAVTSIPVANGVVSGAPGITTGPNGDIWFTEADTDQVGEINPTTHAVTAFSVPTPLSHPVGITAGPGGTLFFTERSFAQIGQVSLSATTLTLYPSPNPVSLGKPLTLTATVSSAGEGTPTGTVTFVDGSNALGSAPLDAAGVATLVVPSQGFGLHRLRAFYSNDPAFANSVSNTVTETVAPPDGPQVVAVARLGVHNAPTTLVLGFDGPLHPATAQDPANYKIVGPGGRVISVKSAVFDAASDTVNVTPRSRLDVHQTYRLTVVGTGPRGVTDSDGRLLDGTDSGQPGSDFVTTVTKANLVAQPVPKVSRFNARAARAAQLASVRAAVAAARHHR